MASEMKPFLLTDEPQVLHKPYNTERHYYRKLNYALLIHFIMVASYTIIFVFMVQKLKAEPPTSLNREAPCLRARVPLMSLSE